MRRWMEMDWGGTRTSDMMGGSIDRPTLNRSTDPPSHPPPPTTLGHHITNHHQELLARASEAPTTPTPRTQIDDLFIFNGGIFPKLHRPVLMQRLLLHPWVGPVLSRYAMGYWTFAKGVQGVFSPEHAPSAAMLADMWEVRGLGVVVPDR
jgi:hypothetical protein